MFIETKEGYVCECGTNTFTIEYNGRSITLRNRVIFSKTSFVRDDYKTIFHFQLIFANDKPADKWFVKSLYDLHINCNHKQKAHFKKDFIKSCNEQIANALDKMYGVGGEKYLESQRIIDEMSEN